MCAYMLIFKSRAPPSPLEEFWLPSAALNPFLPPRSCLSLQRDSSFSQVTIVTRVRKAPTVALDLNHETLEGGREGRVSGPLSDIGASGGETARREAGRKQEGKNKAQFGRDNKGPKHERCVAPFKRGVKLVTDWFQTKHTHTPWFCARVGASEGLRGG